MAAPLLVLDDVRKVYTRGRVIRRPTFTLQANLSLEEPGIVGVVGPNGAGKTTLFEMMTGSNAPTSGRVLVAGTDIHGVKYRERDRLAIHYHQSYQVRRFRKRVPSALLAPSPTRTPLVHLFDEPQFNLQDGYIGFMLDFFRKLRDEGRLVILCMHPTASWHLDILAEIAGQFLFVAGGGVTRMADFRTLAAEPRFRLYLGPEMTRAADAICHSSTLKGDSVGLFEHAAFHCRQMAPGPFGQSDRGAQSRDRGGDRHRRACRPVRSRRGAGRRFRRLQGLAQCRAVRALPDHAQGRRDHARAQ